MVFIWFYRFFSWFCFSGDFFIFGLSYGPFKDCFLFFLGFLSKSKYRYLGSRTMVDFPVASKA